MNTFKQIASATRIAVKSTPQRTGASLVVVIGIAGVVVVLLSVLAMAFGLTRAVTEAGSNDRAIVLRKGADSEGGSSLLRDAVVTIENAPGVAKLPNGDALASPELLASVAVEKKGAAAPMEVSLRGVGPRAFTLRPEVVVTSGRPFRSGMHELIVGRALQAQTDSLKVGSEVHVRNTVWKVVGTFTSQGDVHESELMADLGALSSVYEQTIVQSVTVKLASTGSFETFKSALAANPSLSVDVLREREYFQQRSRQLVTVISVVAYIVGGIMAIGAMFAALNTMYSAVSSRRTEIATLRAIGFGNVGVVISVLAESLLLALVGASIGALIVFVVFNGQVISTTEGSGQIVARMLVDSKLLVLGITWACIIGLIGGVFPAIRAARLPIAVALRP